MYLKAMLVCDDVRVEASGTFTLVGVYNERMIAPPGDGAIQLRQLSCVAIVGGLSGRDHLDFRQHIREAAGPEQPALPLRTEPHDPRADEHNFVFSQSPMIFPQPGTYEVVLELAAGDERVTYRYKFQVERAATP
jgi:hypothetical protein